VLAPIKIKNIAFKQEGEKEQYAEERPADSGHAALPPVEEYEAMVREIFAAAIDQRRRDA
jgi:Na+-transporting methylmalonyl-CoA/oxaloacetate decarboxylase gamma subunit